MQNDKFAVICGVYSGELGEMAEECSSRRVICADRGHVLASAAGIDFELAVGDFDSSPRPDGVETVVLPVEKDDTDLVHAIREAAARGARDVLILGGLGGRLDHTIATLQTLSFARSLGIERCAVEDGFSRAFLITSGCSAVIQKRDGWRLSAFAWDGKCTDVFERGVKYPLEHAVLTPSFPIGVSNEFGDGDASVGVGNGTLLVILTRSD